MPNTSPLSAPSSAHLDHRARQLSGALRDLIAVHEHVATGYGKALPRVRVAIGDILIFDSSEPSAAGSRKQRCVELARTLLRRVDVRWRS